ncbi:MAG TPA: protein-methionine-sulfoxide reductase catalytic subunit MsrP [Bryobacteraceae bacterium]|nr:protein-methionine-sulfoxide reductase catalytic subunit MsrP [Bryobacteraceae bacterium]
MLIGKPADLRYSQVTPKSVYLTRRRFLSLVPAAAGALTIPSLIQPAFGAAKLTTVKSPLSATNEKLTPQDWATHYNNYYEFGTGKEDPAKYAGTLKTSPWTVAIEGLVAKPKTIDIDAIMKVAPLEERIYRHRCVERWSMVVPWIGYSLSALLKTLDVSPKAKYVAFETLHDPKQMPKARFGGLDFPYVEGLRMDEAMHPLTLLCVGLYGEVLPNQNGAPVRIVVPWKYGFKSIKSIVKIKLVEKQPPTSWNLQAASEYGFYSNVNPEVDHPRWSQAKERRLGELANRDTIKFNGYGDQVASLYTGLDLRKNY